MVHDAFFDTVLARVPGRAAEVVAAAREAGVHLRLVDADHVAVSVGQDATSGAIWRLSAPPSRSAATRRLRGPRGWGSGPGRRRT